MRKLRDTMAPLVTKTALLKKAGGVPKVEAVIDVLSPMFVLHWRQQSEAAIREIERRNREAFNRDTVVAVLASLTLRLEVIRGSDVALAEEIVDALFLAGQQAGGLLGDGLAPFLEGLDARAAAVDDLRLILAGKAREVRGAARRALEAQVVQITSPADARLALRLTLQEAFGADGAWLRTAVSNWAYRWYGAAVAAAAQAQGFTRLRAVNNPPVGPDQRTTPFCIWAHGREIVGGTGAVLTQFTLYIQAVREGDDGAVQRLMPFNDQAPRSGVLTAPPPYHHNCRTVPEVIR